MQEVVCPKCQHDDKIASVPGIVKTDTTKRKVSGPVQVGGEWTTATMTEEAITARAQELERPSDPRRGEGIGCIAGSAVAVSLSMAVVGCGLTLFALSLSSTLEIIAALCAGPIMFALGSVVTVLIVRGDSARKKEALAKVPAWEAADEKWNRSYYCERDHIVFDPDTGDWAEPSPEWFYSVAS